MPVDLDAIKRRAEAATRGPWERIGSSVIAPQFTAWEWEIHVSHSHSERRNADAEFIAHARTDIPALCDEIERLRGVVSELRDDVRDAIVDGMACDMTEPYAFNLRLLKAAAAYDTETERMKNGG